MLINFTSSLSFHFSIQTVSWMDPKQPSGNTSSLGWPSCCHIPYWRNEGCRFLSAVDVFDFLGIRCRHGYGCIECHLECSGISDAFAKSTAVNDDDDRHCFLSLEAFIHLLFGGHPPCCVNAVTNNLVNEIRHFIIEVLVKCKWRSYIVLYIYLLSVYVLLFCLNFQLLFSNCSHFVMSGSA